MKKVLSIAILICMLATLAIPAFATTDTLSEGLIAHYTFDEYDPVSQTYADSATAKTPANIEKMMGSAYTSDGPVGKAAYFDGATVFQADTSVFGDQLELSTLSISFWIYADKYPAEKADGNQYVFTTYNWAAGDLHMAFVWGDYPGSCQAALKGNTTASGEYSYKNYYRTPMNEPGQWVLMTFVYDSNNASMKYYANGELVESATYESAVPVIFTGISVGGQYEYKNYINAYLDDFRIYNRLLSDSEVNQLYLSGTPVVVPSATLIPDAEETTAAPADTTAAPADTTEAPADTTATPADDTTATPVADDTTAAPVADDTTAAPANDTTAAPTDAETTAAASSSGCGSSVAGAAVALVAVLGGALVTKKKSK